MPELPEVEVVRRGFARHCQGATIANITVHHPRAVRHMDPAPESLSTMFAGATISNIARRGKFMWVEFSDAAGAGGASGAADSGAGAAGAGAASSGASGGPADSAASSEAADAAANPATDPTAAPVGTKNSQLPAVVVHLGMSGQIRVFPQAQDAPLRHGRIQVDFNDGRQLWFVDQRTFGYWDPNELVADPFGMQSHIPQRIAHIGPDLLEYTDLQPAIERLQARATTAKRALLDQNIIAGIGNIYCDEMLWQAQIHPNQPLRTLKAQQLEQLLSAGQEIMQQAIIQGGTSFDELYVNVNGQSGYFDLSLHAYGRGGQECHRCATTMIREKYAGRATVYCPKCQVLQG